MGLRNRIARIRLSRLLRMQFCLRSLLLAMLVVCLALGWYVEHVRRQQSSLEGRSDRLRAIHAEPTRVMIGWP